MTAPARVLIVGWAAGGNVLPAAGLARVLSERGHSVVALAPPVLRLRFERAGCRFRPMQRARPPHPMETGVFDENLLAWTRFVSGRPLAEEVREAIRLEGVDVVVVDAFLTAGLAAAEAERVPAVALVHVLYQPAVEGEIAEQWEPARAMVDSTRRHLGLGPLGVSEGVVAGTWSRAGLVLACVPEQFDYPVSRPPGNLLYAGPVFDEPPAAPRSGPASTVLVSFSTTDMRHGGALQRVLDAVAALDVEVVCTLGGVPVPGLRPPPNVTVVEWAPHRQLLAGASAVVTHAGLSTVMTSLASGVPLVCMPMGRDQPMNGDRVAALGLGVTVARDATVADLGDALAGVLTRPRYRERAGRMAEVIAGYGNGSVALAGIEGLLVAARSGRSERTPG